MEPSVCVVEPEAVIPVSLRGGFGDRLVLAFALSLAAIFGEDVFYYRARFSEGRSPSWMARYSGGAPLSVSWR